MPSMADLLERRLARQRAERFNTPVRQIPEAVSLPLRDASLCRKDLEALRINKPGPSMWDLLKKE